jgi:hypothetical protein
MPNNWVKKAELSDEEKSRLSKYYESIYHTSYAKASVNYAKALVKQCDDVAFEEFNDFIRAWNDAGVS